MTLLKLQLDCQPVVSVLSRSAVSWLHGEQDFPQADSRRSPPQQSDVEPIEENALSRRSYGYVRHNVSGTVVAAIFRGEGILAHAKTATPRRYHVCTLHNPLLPTLITALVLSLPFCCRQTLHAQRETEMSGKFFRLPSWPRAGDTLGMYARVHAAS
jgi:hypothetical protein